MTTAKFGETLSEPREFPKSDRASIRLYDRYDRQSEVWTFSNPDYMFSVNMFIETSKNLVGIDWLGSTFKWDQIMIDYN